MYITILIDNDDLYEAQNDHTKYKDHNYFKIMVNKHSNL